MKSRTRSVIGTPHGRSWARRSALQAIYQWQISGTQVGEIVAQFLAEQDMRKVDTEYFTRLLHGIPTRIDVLDAEFAPLLDRPLQQLTPIELAILRIGAYELVDCPDVPWRVVINEGVELAKTFGASDSHKYINSILDKLAHRLRAVEVRA